jgi:hypothetical protein
MRAMGFSLHTLKRKLFSEDKRGRPRLTIRGLSPVLSKGDWEPHIEGMNPDGVRISDKLKGL